MKNQISGINSKQTNTIITEEQSSIPTTTEQTVTQRTEENDRFDNIEID
jgi:hypothetical protein